MTRVIRRSLLALIVPFAAIAAWWWFSRDSTSVYFPPLATIWAEFQELWLFEEWPANVIPSLRRMAIGFLISLVSAIALGVLIGMTPLLRRATAPYVEFFRAIPPA